MWLYRASWGCGVLRRRLCIHRSAAPLAMRGWFEPNAPCEQPLVVRQQLAQLVTTHIIVAGSIPAGAQDFDLICAFVCVAKTAQQLYYRPIGHPRLARRGGRSF